jgi:signal transduction histidine kinase
VSLTVSPIKDGDGKIAGVSKIARDISERKRLEKEILEIRDSEQRRIGQDLHDGLSQHLAGIEMMLQVLKQNLGGKSKSASAQADKIAGHMREAITQTRMLARGLSPVSVESNGLMSALQELAVSGTQLFDIRCSFKCAEPILINENAIATQLFRIAQEALNNAVKHGKARIVEIRLQKCASGAQLIITDDGRGFPKRLGQNEGMGLRIMKYRADLIGAALQICGGNRKGTVVACEFKT